MRYRIPSSNVNWLNLETSFLIGNGLTLHWREFGTCFCDTKCIILEIWGLSSCSFWISVFGISGTMLIFISCITPSGSSVSWDFAMDDIKIYGISIVLSTFWINVSNCCCVVIVHIPSSSISDPPSSIGFRLSASAAALGRPVQF